MPTRTAPPSHRRTNDPNGPSSHQVPRQGGRPVYAVDLSLTQIAGLLPQPARSAATTMSTAISSRLTLVGSPSTNKSGNRGLGRAPGARPCSTGLFKFEAPSQLAGTEFGVLLSPPGEQPTCAYSMARNPHPLGIIWHPKA